MLAVAAPPLLFFPELVEAVRAMLTPVEMRPSIEDIVGQLSELAIGEGEVAEGEDVEVPEELNAFDEVIEDAEAPEKMKASDEMVEASDETEASDEGETKEDDHHQFDGSTDIRDRGRDDPRDVGRDPARDRGSSRFCICRLTMVEYSPYWRLVRGVEDSW
ncbi:hypothetical protein BGX29_009385 [Mortierella sp. GBA35]|nr:hypothetical protein BGX29_009385 [Mortierella sp. GBA35]